MPIQGILSVNTITNKKVEENHTPIIFIHGTHWTGSDWETMKNRFVADGWPFSYLQNPTLVDSLSCGFVEQKAVQIKDLVNEVLQSTHAPKVDLVTL